MLTTPRSIRSGRVRWALLALLLVVSACGTEDIPSSEATDVGEGPTTGDHLSEVLARDQIAIRDGSFDTGLSAAETLDAFAKVYAPGTFDGRATAYAVVMESSMETRLPAGRDVRMVHVPGVEQDVTPPSPPPGKDGQSQQAPSETVTTDVFAFFDARTGEHLATVYIGPPA